MPLYNSRDSIII